MQPNGRLCVCGAPACLECAGRELTPAQKKALSLLTACRCGECVKCKARERRREVMRRKRAETPWQKQSLAHICAVVGLRWMVPSTLESMIKGRAFSHVSFNAQRRNGPKLVGAGSRS